jgi:hypothetical protein
MAPADALHDWVAIRRLPCELLGGDRDELMVSSLGCNTPTTLDLMIVTPASWG